MTQGDAMAGFGSRVVYLRRLLRLRQNDLAARLGVDGKTLSRLETGRQRAIRLDMLGNIIAVAEEAGLEGDWLLTGRTTTERPTGGPAPARPAGGVGGQTAVDVQVWPRADGGIDVRVVPVAAAVAGAAPTAERDGERVHA